MKFIKIYINKERKEFKLQKSFQCGPKKKSKQMVIYDKIWIHHFVAKAKLSS